MQGDTYKKVHIQTLQYKETQHKNKYQGQVMWNQWGRKALLTYEQTCKATGQAHFGNGFFSAFLQAYNNHGDVKISPDDNTAEGVTQKFQSNFSTTGRIEKLISIATVMNTYQKYFSYGRCIPMCGIQNVHFGGSLEDWKNLRLKLEHLRQYDVDGNMKSYVNKVSFIIQKFIQTYQENVDLDFWNKIVNSERGRLGSGSTTKYSGWLIHFFGLDGSVEEVEIESLGFDIEIDNKMTGIKKTVRLVGGFKSISQEGQVFRPHLSLAIRDAEAEQQQRLR